MNYYYTIVYSNSLYVAYIANKHAPNFQVFIACCEADDLHLNTYEEIISVLDLNAKLDKATYINELINLKK